MNCLSQKKLKDPIYGYISIPEALVRNVIDTAPFQRLRRIIQTSYSPLYPSALHNRFVHSLGVYHLGIMAKSALMSSLKAKLKLHNLKLKHCNISKLGEVFELACLLHDVGHAPFSHTGETFYAKCRGKSVPLHDELYKFIGRKSFNDDVPGNESEQAAPHEIVSAIVGIKEYKSLLCHEEEFFARCITGYLYKGQSIENSIRYCFILLLNSSLIDVDKLDYLIRDAYVTGYDSVGIDYHRLLNSITVTYDKSGGVFSLAYLKGAISVIENVVYARDLERKWIQTHPVVIYENFILQCILEKLAKKYDNNVEERLFAVKALSEEGVCLKKNWKIRLLSDDDIISLMKSRWAQSPFVKEYFNRNNRRHPVWKSEAEYRLVFEKKTSVKTGKRIRQSFELLMEYLEVYPDLKVIDKAFVFRLQNELKELERIKETLLDSETILSQIENKREVMNVVVSLLGDDWKTSGRELVFLKSTQFISGFSALHSPKWLNDIKIVFNDSFPEKSYSFSDLVVTLKEKQKMKRYFFFLYSNDRLSPVEIAKRLSRCRRVP